MIYLPSFLLFISDENCPSCFLERGPASSPLSLYVPALPFQELLPQWLQTCNKLPLIPRNALYWLIFSPFSSELPLTWFSSHFCWSFPHFYPLYWQCWWCCPWSSSILSLCLSDQMHSQALNHFLQLSKHLVSPPAVSNSRAVCLTIYLIPHRLKIYIYAWCTNDSSLGIILSHGKKTILPLCPCH